MRGLLIGATTATSDPPAIAGFAPDRPWRLHEQVALRPERFGALAYHFGTRRLSFVKDHGLLAVVEALADHPTAEAAMEAVGVPHGRRRVVERALATLAASSTIAPRGPRTPDPGPPVTSPGHQPPGSWSPDVDTSAAPATPTTDPGPAPARSAGRLVDEFELGLDAPICLTWELTYACNLQCVHCLSSSGRRDPRELTTAECMAVVDELRAMQVFYVNIGGGEPTVRPDFWELVDYATDHQVGVKFSTNGIAIDDAAARRLAASDYVDVQVSLDGATAGVNDAVRGTGSFATARRAMDHLATAGVGPFKVSVVATRHNVDQLDALKALADDHGAQLRLTRLRPSGRGADAWDDLHVTADQQQRLYEWLLGHGEDVLTGDSFFHLGAYGESLPGLNLCGAGRVVCLVDPIGDVYACPFAIHDQFLAGNVRDPGGFTRAWRESELFTDLRSPQSGGACTSCGMYDACRGGCMAAKFFTGLALDGPDPECVRGLGEEALAARGEPVIPRPAQDHSRGVRLPVLAAGPDAVPDRPCDTSPLAGMAPRDGCR